MLKIGDRVYLTALNNDSHDGSYRWVVEVQGSWEVPSSFDDLGYPKSTTTMYFYSYQNKKIGFYEEECYPIHLRLELP